MYFGGCGSPRSWWVTSGHLPCQVSGALRSLPGVPNTGACLGLTAGLFPRAAFQGRERGCTKALGSHGKQIAGKFANCPQIICLNRCCSSVTQLGLGNDSTLPAEVGWKGPGVSSDLSSETKDFHRCADRFEQSNTSECLSSQLH